MSGCQHSLANKIFLSFFAIQEEELRNIIEMGRSMEDVFGHYFDCVIIHYDHDRAYRDLTNEIGRIQTEPQWVPIQWIRS